jgi:hypothetical protein
MANITPLHKRAGLRDGAPPHNRANSGLFVENQEHAATLRLRGGPGRTRTANQAVMSAPLCWTINVPAAEWNSITTRKSTTSRLFTHMLPERLNRADYAVVGHQALAYTEHGIAIQVFRPNIQRTASRIILGSSRHVPRSFGGTFGGDALKFL